MNTCEFCEAAMEHSHLCGKIEKLQRERDSFKGNYQRVLEREAHSLAEKSALILQNEELKRLLDEAHVYYCGENCGGGKHYGSCDDMTAILLGNPKQPKCGCGEEITPQGHACTFNPSVGTGGAVAQKPKGDCKCNCHTYLDRNGIAISCQCCPTGLSRGITEKRAEPSPKCSECGAEIIGGGADSMGPAFNVCAKGHRSR